MSTSKPRLAIVSSHNICCALAYYADAIKDFLNPSFDVEIIDLKTSALLRQEGENYYKMSETYIDELCIKLRAFDVVNIHLELGLFGTSTDIITSRILRLCQAAGRLILTVHTIEYKHANSDHSFAYQQIIGSLKQRPASNPYHLIVHLRHEKALMEKIYGVSSVVDFPLIFLTDERRKYFKGKRNPVVWKKQFGLREEDITIGMFGLLSEHKNYLHALRTLGLLPANYKLLVIGEAHHMSIKERKVDPVIQEMVSYLDSHQALAERVIFTGRRDDAKYYEDLANIDFVLLPSYEVNQTGSATLSNAMELGCAVLKSNISNTKGYEAYFPDCFEVFDVGNYYETKHKILNFDRGKIDNLHQKIDQFSEVQFRQMYLNIYAEMQPFTPIQLSSNFNIASARSAVRTFSGRPAIRKLFYRMPGPIQSLLKKARRVVLKNRLS